MRALQPLQQAIRFGVRDLRTNVGNAAAFTNMRHSPQKN
jgi:hypothetical protein